MIKGLVACGSGIATSTVAQQAVKKILADAGIEADISKGNITEIPVKQNTVDIIFTTSNYTQPTKVPAIISSLILSFPIPEIKPKTFITGTFVGCV